MTRTVLLHLLDAAGRPLGVLPRYDVPAPWWQEVGDVVAGARTRYGLDVSVLRLLHADRSGPPGGTVGYLAQLSEGAALPSGLPLAPTRLDLSAEPLRAPWAVPGGPAASLRWAAAELHRAGRGPHVAVPQRAWNLSAIWRLDMRGPDMRGPEGAGPDGAVGAGPPVWLKQVPGFFAHEPVLLRWLGTAVPDLVPVLIAADDHGRMLLEHVPGEDGYGLPPAGRAEVAADHHRLQLASVDQVERLVAAGVPDRRGMALARTVRDRLAAHGPDLAQLRSLLDGLPDRLAELGRCGLPDTLVHGDLHPGNVRIAGDRRVIIDWGDGFVGHPGFDILRLTESVEPEPARTLVEEWVRRWRSSVPGSDPARAIELLRPVAPLWMAAVAADFLARIEPAERAFHAADVPALLSLAARTA
ncbi:aminoglycoside phosphotransferase family protein [Micromonospora sp. WMMD1102]|uniref:aminoglycoside phosphotransferase family protein n=1 Tax=Micromonospora sp. WMMD1102 TaxID=3016105 RepID=UPI0024155503|nr:aminoglycoside phosphotransferase family protein [Micromonospora sp. WMMD1102]MDG4788381.1 aminoglycoside phosphotransferase family protein [Micromonospora sp. WMMD1102]